jgi:hypothetical protein
MAALLEQARRVATRVPQQTELDHFAAYIDSGAIITLVTAHSITAEGGESTRSYEPREGLTEEVYCRLACDDLSRTMLAWGVIENLLRRKGLNGRQIAYAKRLVPEEVLPALVEYHSFGIVAEALANEGSESVESPRSMDMVPVGVDSPERMGRSVIEEECIEL